MTEYKVRTNVTFFDDDRNILRTGYTYSDRLKIYDKYENKIFEGKSIFDVGAQTRIRSDDIREYVDELVEGEKLKVVNIVKPLGGYGKITNTEYIDEDDFVESVYRDEYFHIIRTDVYEENFEELDEKFKSVEERIGGLSLEEVDLTRLADERNIDTVITSTEGTGAKVRAITQENTMSFESDEIRIEGTDFVESIRNQPERIELTLVLGDVWKGGELVTHRQKELEKLKDMYSNNDLLRIESNLTHDIYGSYEGNEDIKEIYDTEGPMMPRKGPRPNGLGKGVFERELPRYKRISIPNVAKLDNVLIESMEVTQGGESANTYECSLTLRKVNFVESEDFQRRPTELTGVSIRDGELDRRKHQLETEEDEPDDDEEEELYYGRHRRSYYGR